MVSTISGNVPIFCAGPSTERAEAPVNRRMFTDRVCSMLIAQRAVATVYSRARVRTIQLLLGTQMSLLQVAWVSSLVFLLQALPISIAGLGVREGAYVYILSLYGFSTDLGFALGLLFFTHMLVFAAIGGILNVTEALSQSKDRTVLIVAIPKSASTSLATSLCELHGLTNATATSIRYSSTGSRPGVQLPAQLPRPAGHRPGAGRTVSVQTRSALQAARVPERRKPRNLSEAERRSSCCGSPRKSSWRKSGRSRASYTAAGTSFPTAQRR